MIAVALRRFGTRALLLAPAAWVATELARTLLFGGFPWALVGYTQTTVLPVAQSASAVGVYGLSFLVVLASAALATAGAGRDRSGLVAVGLTAVLVASTAVWGSARLADGRLTRTGTQVRVGLVQGNVAQDQKWAPELEDEILGRYLALSRQAADRGARAILWPESSTPFFFENSPKSEAIRLFARERGASVLLGSDEADRSNPRILQLRVHAAARRQHGGRLPQGAPRAVRRVRAVQARCCSSRRRWSRPCRTSAPGARPVMLPLGGHPVSTAICYEVVYPELDREASSSGSELLTTITNDAWFGRSSAP